MITKPGKFFNELRNFFYSYPPINRETKKQSTLKIKEGVPKFSKDLIEGNHLVSNCTKPKIIKDVDHIKFRYTYSLE